MTQDPNPNPNTNAARADAELWKRIADELMVSLEVINKKAGLDRDALEQCGSVIAYRKACLRAG